MEEGFKISTQSDYTRDSRFESEINDCVVIALANAAEITYPDAHNWVSVMMDRKRRKPTYNTVHHMKMVADSGQQIFGKSVTQINELINKDYTHKDVQYTIKTFAQKFNKGNYFLLVKSHALCIKDGVIYDHLSLKDKNRRPVKAAFKIE